jgi:hypothetical protein
MKVILPGSKPEVKEKLGLASNSSDASTVFETLSTEWKEPDAQETYRDSDKPLLLEVSPASISHQSLAWITNGG